MITDKIVTFSYGTISCSLQGFDDNFDILKPIAEYCHGLSANGTQHSNGLPRPDAQDLAHIISDIIAHPVEGYEAQGMIILKPVETPVDTSAKASADSPEVDDQTPDRNDPEETAELLTTEDEEALMANGHDAEPDQDGNIFGLHSDEEGDEEGESPLADTDESAGDVEELSAAEETEAVEESAGAEAEENVAAAEAEENANGEEASEPVIKPSRIGRVIKMRREDFDAAISNGVIEEEPGAPEEAAAQTNGEMQSQDSDPESSPDVQRHLAEASEKIAAMDAVVTPSKPKMIGRRRKGVDRLESSERRSDLDRIFGETNSQLVKSDTKERRDAIHHLRAAVAATRAENSAGHGLGRSIDEAPYRTDLAEAVDDPADVAAAQRGRRRAASNLPPLRLASDQRIDDGE